MTGQDRKRHDDAESVDPVEVGEEQSTSSASRTSANVDTERIRYNPTREDGSV